MGSAGLSLAFLMFSTHRASIFFPSRPLIKGASGLYDVHISTDGPFWKHTANCSCHCVLYNGLKPYCRTSAGWAGPKSLKALRRMCVKGRVSAYREENSAGTWCSWDVKSAPTPQTKNKARRQSCQIWFGRSFSAPSRQIFCIDVTCGTFLDSALADVQGRCFLLSRMWPGFNPPLTWGYLKSFNSGKDPICKGRQNLKCYLAKPPLIRFKQTSQVR